jgi:hypothetical protein
MLLAHPAGESVDEHVFSGSQRTLTKDRNRFEYGTIEEITIIRVFIKNFGFSVTKLDEWVKETKTRIRKQEFEKQKQLETTEKKNK